MGNTAASSSLENEEEECDRTEPPPCFNTKHQMSASVAKADADIEENKKTVEVLPNPRNGSQYTPSEIVAILNLFGTGKEADDKRLELKKTWIENGLVGPKTMNGLNRSLRKIKAASAGATTESLTNVDNKKRTAIESPTRPHEIAKRQKTPSSLPATNASIAESMETLSSLPATKAFVVEGKKANDDKEDESATFCVPKPQNGS